MRILLIWALCGLLTACDHKKGDFVISGLGVNFAPYNTGTGKAGDFIFTMAPNKVFLEFGAQVMSPNGPKELPTFEYLLDPNAAVMAIAKGKVNRFVYQADTDDYEIGAVSTLDPAFSVVYDHIKSPTVGKGDTLVSGQVLGKPGSWDATYGRFEIMINNDDTELSYCPFVYFDAALKTEYQQKVTRLMQDWETYKGDNSIYDEASHVFPGCRYESMSMF